MCFPMLDMPNAVYANYNKIVGNKFIRRHELTTFDRLQIVYEAYSAKVVTIQESA